MNTLRELLSTDLSAALISAQMRAGWRRFSTWWLAECRQLWPEFLATRLLDYGKPVICLLVETDNVRVEVTSPRRRVIHTGFVSRSDYSTATLDRHLAGIGRLRNAATVGVILPRDCFFHRSFGIPARARERVHAISRQELEHRTPFQVDDVHFGMTVVPNQRNSSTLTIHQTIVRKDLLEAAARDLDLPLQEIAFVAPAADDENSIAQTISLRPDSGHRNPPTRRLVLALTVAAGIVAGADAVLFWWAQERMIEAVETRATVERKKASTVRGLEDEIARVQSALHTLEDRRRLPSIASLWRETSRVLPDTSWVTDWRRHGGGLSLGGFSANATELVGLFEKSKLFGETSLDAPITLDSPTGREHFSLAVRMRDEARLTQR